MSRTPRFAAALLLLASLTCGSLGALPFGSRRMPAETEGSFLTAVVHWIASVFTPDHPGRTVPEPPSPTKDSSSLDPGGGSGGGH